MIYIHHTIKPKRVKTLWKVKRKKTRRGSRYKMVVRTVAGHDWMVQLIWSWSMDFNVTCPAILSITVTVVHWSPAEILTYISQVFSVVRQQPCHPEGGHSSPPQHLDDSSLAEQDEWCLQCKLLADIIIHFAQHYHELNISSTASPRTGDMRGPTWLLSWVTWIYTNQSEASVTIMMP